MKLAHKLATVVVLSVALVPVGAAAASANPVVDAYCAAQEAAGVENVQDCRFLAG